MSHDLESVAARRLKGGELAGETVRQLLIIPMLTIALTGCGLSASRDVRAYNVCIARHPQDAAVCEGPRQAYELNPTAFQTRAAAFVPPAGGSYEEPSPAANPLPTPMPPHPSSIASGRKG